jgi:hypothetical protein
VSRPNSRQDKKAARKRIRLEKEKKAAAKAEKAEKASKANGAESKATGNDAKDSSGTVQKRTMQASVEEAEDD